MITFRQYIEEKDQQGLGDIGNNDPETLQRLCRIAEQDHLKELIGFFEHLAKKDRRFRDELDNYNRANHPDKKPPVYGSAQAHDEKDVISIPQADRASEIENNF